jgi:Concanavalin A-like lectin/glucanases superfamily
MSSPARFNFWGKWRKSLITEKMRQTITLESFEAGCGLETLGSLYFQGAQSPPFTPSYNPGFSSSEVTIESKVKFTGSSSGTKYPIVCIFLTDSGSRKPKYELGVIDNTLYFSYTQGGSVVTITTNVLVPYNSWSHVAVTWDGTIITLYINKVAVTTAALAAPVDSTDDVLGVGVSRYLVNRMFTGYLNEVRIWSVTRTLDEIKTFADSPIDNAAGLLFYTRLYTSDEIVASSLYDRITSALVQCTALEVKEFVTGIYAPLIYGASFIAAQFDITLTSPSALQFPVARPTGCTFMLVVRWVDQADGVTVQRRRLWDLDGVDIAPFPETYNGETLPEDYVLECWNVDGAATIELPSDLVLYTSLTTEPTTDTDHANVAAITNPVVDTTLAEPLPLANFPLEFNTQQTYA